MVAARWPDIPEPEVIASRTLTLDEWLALDEDDHHELVDGRLEGEVPGYLHATIVAHLIAALYAWGDKRGAWLSQRRLTRTASR